MPAPSPRLTAQEIATRRLRRAILGGEFSGARRLPPERELAERYGVSRLTLRGALASLTSEGLVRPRQGSGLELLAVEQNASLDVLAMLLETADEDPRRSLDLFEQTLSLRRSVAVDVVRRAQRHASRAERRELRDLADDQESRVGNREAYVAGDERFQRHVLALARSTPSELVFNGVWRALNARPELLDAYYGERARHARTYRRTARLVRLPKAYATRRRIGSEVAAFDRLALGRVARALGLPKEVGRTLN
jgi:DNA-binding FadR family transcriptional regulator